MPEAATEASASPATAPALEIRGLTKVFRQRRKPPLTAVDNLSLTMDVGEIVGLLGPNGAGKTTIIKCVLGLVRPTAGEIRVFGHDVATDHAGAIRHAGAVLEGARNIYWRMTPRENLRFFTGLHGLDWRVHQAYFEELLERFSLTEKADEPVMNLSTGMKQKVAAVCALAKQTGLVFLDEPTLGLDIETSLELRRILRELADEGRRTIVVSSHDMDVIQDVCRRVVIIKQGRIVADDRVDTLLELFRTRAYRLVLSDGLTGEILADLERTTHDLVVERRGAGQTELTFSLSSAELLYRVIELLRETGALIETISQQEPDLEEAFLRVIKSDGVDGNGTDDGNGIGGRGTGGHGVGKAGVGA